MKAVIFILTLASAVVRISFCDTCPSEGTGTSKKKSMTADDHPSHFNVVLVGATGNLASKYLWKALFDVFRERFDPNRVRFQIYGCARQDQDDGRTILSNLLLDLVKCADDACRETKRKFVEASQYLRLKTERDFQKLESMLDENTQSVYGLIGSPVSYEVGRLVYLSIPPSSYAKTSKFVNQYLRPKVGRPWMRIVLEKPFGRDLESAEKLAKQLEGYFDEQELYRIDHYLGKAVVKQILPFRYINRNDFDPIWNHEHIERVDIIMKEKDDAVGRTLFYNEVGIIRDVMQNHLTELMALVAMELPETSGNISAIQQSKVRVLRQVRPPNERTTLTAQYSTYNREWMKEQGLTGGNASSVATFAASVLFVDNERWRGVPFVLASGKKLDEKSSYVRVKFRNARFCLRASEAAAACDRQRQLVFLVGGTNLRLPPMVAASRGLPSPALKSGWTAQTSKLDLELFGQRMDEMVRFFPDADSEPYVELLGAVLDGARHLFVSTEMLIASWRFWTPAIALAERSRPRQYMGHGKDAERLDFVVTSRGLYFQLNDRDVFASSMEETASVGDAATSRVSVVPDSFRNATLVAGSERYVTDALAAAVATAADAAVSARGVFHLAVPGGTSPVGLFRRLSELALPWDSVHVWMADERCVPPSSDESNFRVLERHLLSTIRIPYGNVHPVPVDLTDEPCGGGEPDAALRADDVYDNLIRRRVGSGLFDFVVLGVGADGHVASLFPRQPTLRESERYACLADSVAPPSKRVTLTLSAINKADRVALLVLGKGKHEMLTEVGDSHDDQLYPVVGVKPQRDGSSVTWYVDYDALFG